jgi:DNA-binding GntR family transcriptional regulator
MYMPEIQAVPPKYEQIAQDIRDQIADGRLKPGQMVPSSRTLAYEWRVSRPTAADALERLKKDGLVASRPGSGTFVLPPHAQTHQDARRNAAAIDVSFVPEYLTVKLDPAPKHVAEALVQEVDEPAVRRQLLVRDPDGIPMRLVTSWFPAGLAEAAPLLLQPEHIEDGAEAYIAEHTERKPFLGRGEKSARLATELECEQLQLEPPAAVLVHHLAVFDSQGSALHFDETIYRGDIWIAEPDHAFTHTVS